MVRSTRRRADRSDARGAKSDSRATRNSQTQNPKSDARVVYRPYVSEVMYATVDRLTKLWRRARVHQPWSSYLASLPLGYSLSACRLAPRVALAPLKTVMRAAPALLFARRALLLQAATTARVIAAARARDAAGRRRRRRRHRFGLRARHVSNRHVSSSGVYGGGGTSGGGGVCCRRRGL